MADPILDAFPGMEVSLELRNRVILLQRERYGQTFEEIARVWGMTRERVRQVCIKEAQRERRREMVRKLEASL